MEIAEILNRRKTATVESKITNKRQFLVQMFIDEINKERPCSYMKNGKKVTMPPITTPRQKTEIAIRLAHVSESDLSVFLSECKDYKQRNGSFSKRFFGTLKVRKDG